MRLMFSLLMIAACGPNGNTPPPPEPDGGKQEPVDGGTGCQAVSCGLPGQDMCCEEAICVDFGSFGSTECAMSCQVNADCATGACIQDTKGNSICAPKEYGGVAGIYPENTCLTAADCGFFTDQTACNAFFQGTDDKTGCLGTLSQSELSQWIAAVDNCNTSTACSAIESCFDHLPFCTFTAN
jgi:hypothetical protein